MQHPVSSSIPLVEHENPCPDLVSLTVHWEPVHADPDSASESESGAQTVEVGVSIDFNRPWVAIAGGRVQMAIAQADLSLSLSPGAAFQESDVSSAHPSMTVCPTPTHASDSFQWTLCPLSTAVLDGHIEQLSLGALQLNADPGQLVVTLTTLPRDVRIVEAEGLWRHDITPNKHGILERKLALSLFQMQRLSPLSQAQVCYPDSPSALDGLEHEEGAHQEGEEGAIASPSVAEDLQALLQSVIDAPTNHLLKLAQQAQLLVETDLAGISLRGASLSGLDLSGVDLSQANLRGADLTDAELSDANLSGAKLGGADLSGADLGCANLQGADLHRASLALANLSGANLSGTNLHETHLSQTNLNGAQVHAARFGNNSGLSDEQKALLKERGAVIEDA